jgi:hypothetical protein
MDDEDKFSGLKFLIQYRRKLDGVVWGNMAAFDGFLAGERYLGQQRRDEDWPWEYRMLDIESGTVTPQPSPQATTEPSNG